MPVNPVDVVGNFQRGYQFGTAQKEQKRIESERNQLRQLAPSILQGDASAFNQAATINPGAATELQDASDRQYRRLGNVIGIMRQALDSKNPQVIQRAHQTVSPFLQEMSGGRPVPPQWDDSMLPAFEQIEQRVKMAQAGGSGMPAGFREFQLTAQAAGLQPGTPEYQEAAKISLGQVGRAASGGYSFEMIKGADGRERPARRNPRNGAIEVFTESGWVPLGSAASAGGQPAPTFIGPDGIPIDVSGVTDPAVRQQIVQNPAAFNSVPDMSTAQLPPVQAVGPASFGIGRSPEEQAALTTQATEQAKLDVLPAELNLRTDAAVNEAVRKAEEEARIKREGDLASAEQKKYVDAATTIGLLDEAEQLVRQSTGSRAGAAWDEIMAAFGKSTSGAQAIAALNPIAAKLTLAVPRMEGPQSDADRLLYQKAAGDLANPNLPAATRLAAMGTMRSLATKYRDSGGKPPAQSSQPRRIQGASDYNSLPAGALYIAPDGTTRRKK